MAVECLSSLRSARTKQSGGPRYYDLMQHTPEHSTKRLGGDQPVKRHTEASASNVRTESPKPIGSNVETMELDNDPLPVVPRPEPERPTSPQQTVTIVNLISQLQHPSHHDLYHLRTSPASPIELLSPTTTQPDSEVALRAIESMVVRNLTSEPVYRRDLGLTFISLPPTPSPLHQLGPILHNHLPLLTLGNDQCPPKCSRWKTYSGTGIPWRLLSISRSPHDKHPADRELPHRRLL